MAKIQRVTQKIFGDDAITQQFTQFGTAKTDNPVYTKDLESLQGGEFDDGWADAVQEDYAPYMEDMNGYMYMVTTQLAYILQQGAAIEWDQGTTYYTGSIVCAPDGSGTWYRSLTDNNTAALTNTSAWARVELNKNGTPLFTQITTDYVLSGNDAIGWAMQGSQVQRSVYPEAYDKILSLYDSGSGVTYRGISARRASDGRYITDISYYSAVNSLFSNTGIADFYVIDRVGQYFLLPRNGRFIQYTTYTNNVNQFNDSGLPSLGTVTALSNGDHNHNRGNMNINGWFGWVPDQQVDGKVFTIRNTGTSNATGSGDKQATVTFNANGNWTGNTNTTGAHTHNVSISNAVYGRSTIVQPPASLKLLYYRVGDTAV